MAPVSALMTAATVEMMVKANSTCTTSRPLSAGGNPPTQIQGNHSTQMSGRGQDTSPTATYARGRYRTDADKGARAWMFLPPQQT